MKSPKEEVSRSCRPQSLWSGFVGGRSRILRRRVTHRSMEVYSHQSLRKNEDRRIDRLYQQDSRRQSDVWPVASRAKHSGLEKSAEATAVKKELVDNSLKRRGLWTMTHLLPLHGSHELHRKPQKPTLTWNRGSVLRNKISPGST